MAHKEISAAELLELAKDGATIRTEDRPTIIAQFDELVSKLEGLIEASNARAAADLARSKTQLEILGTLQSLIRSGNVTKSPAVDLTPLKSVLTEIQGNTEPRPLSGYEFTVTSRDRLGDIEKLKVVPISPTRH